VQAGVQNVKVLSFRLPYQNQNYTYFLQTHKKLMAGYKGLEPVKEIVKDFILLAQKLEALGFRYKNGQVYILKQYR
jgi:hypothetical protein